MMRKRSVKRPSSRPAMCLLVVIGCAILIFAMVIIGCSFAINYDEELDFDSASLDETIRSRFNYNQYWAGVPFLITGALVLFSGVFQRNRGLTISCVVFCIISVTLTMFVLVLDTTTFFSWNNMERRKSFWDSKNGYSCGTDNASKTCRCAGPAHIEMISAYECNIVSKMSALYGSLIAAAIFVAMLSLFAVLVILNSLSWKRVVYTTHSGYYNNDADDFYEGTGRSTPSIIDIPISRRDNGYAEAANGKRATPPYRNYNF